MADEATRMRQGHRDDSPARSGLRLARLLVCCLAANLLLAVGAAAASDCSPKPMGSVDISTPRDWIVLMQVMINGHPASMELDTASTASLIKEEYVRPFALRIRGAPVHMGFRSETETYEMTQFVRLTSLAVGTAKFDNPPVWVLPEGGLSDASALGTPDRPDVGRLGVDVLTALDFELDFANHKLNFYSPRHCTGAGVYWTHEYSSMPMTRAPLGNLIFPVELNGKKVEAVISTAMAQSWIYTDATHRLYGFDETSGDNEVRTGGAGGSLVYYREMTLTGFGSSGKHVHIRLDTRSVDSACTLTTRGTGAAYYLGEPCKGNEAPLYLGMDVLRHLHLYYASKDQVVYFSDAAASSEERPAGGSARR